ncbi:hypothetical protein ACS0TY_008060 [Phlomoides rotata]
MESMKGRWKRLSENANKWIVAYKEAYRRKRSGIAGMSQMILRKKLFQFMKRVAAIMCKNPKWEIKLDHDSTHFRDENEQGNEESGGSSKRSRTSEDGEYYIPSNPTF